MGRFGSSGRDRTSRTPLDEPLDDIDSRESQLRNRRGQPSRTISVSSAGLRVLGGVSVLVLALMITSTVMLWQIADKTGSDDNGSAEFAQTAEPPPLPEDEESRGTSSKELLDEFDQLGADLSRPVSSLNGQIASTNEVFGAVSSSLDQLVSQADGLNGTGDTLEEVAKSTKQLSSVDRSLRNLNRDFGTFDSVSSNTEQMNINMGKMIGKLDTSNSQLGSLASLDSKMQQINAQLGTLGSIDTQMQQMNSTLQSMNTTLIGMNDLLPQMKAILDAICPNPPECEPIP